MTDSTAPGPTQLTPGQTAEWIRSVLYRRVIEEFVSHFPELEDSFDEHLSALDELGPIKDDFALGTRPLSPFGCIPPGRSPNGSVSRMGLEPAWSKLKAAMDRQQKQASTPSLRDLLGAFIVDIDQLVVTVASYLANDIHQRWDELPVEAKAYGEGPLQIKVIEERVNTLMASVTAGGVLASLMASLGPAEPITPADTNASATPADTSETAPAPATMFEATATTE